jgi:DNA-binding NtrC family response regulator
VVVDCGSLPPQLIESELFGHERGAFTGAVQRNVGAFEQATGGTIFLDEIGELPLDLQPKLLRAIESRKIRRVGGDSQIPVDVRVVAATNRDLAVEAAKGRFREDLYYRLAVVKLQVPPLRERKDDIALLAYHLLEGLGADPQQLLTEDLVQELQSYHWPGNVRELRNALERHAALGEPLTYEYAAAKESKPSAVATDVIDLSQPLRGAKQTLIDEFERAYIRAQLAACNGNVSECARRAGMDRMSIHRIIQRLGLRGT